MKSDVKQGAGMRLIHLAAAAVAASALVACGGSGSGNSVLDKPGVALYTSAGPQVTVASGSSASFTVAGGGGGSKFVSYHASSSDTRVATAALDGSKLTITGVAGGSAVINVSDSAGASVAINVTVPTSTVPGLALETPSNVTMVPGNSAQYKITGGSGPYTAVASNPNVVTVGSANGAVFVTAANPGSATVVIYDRLGASAKFDLTVSGGGMPVALYTTAPDSLFLPAESTATYKIAGGIAPYTVTSSNTAVVDASGDGNVLTLRSKPPAGSIGARAAVDIRDAQGTLIKISVSVTAEPGNPLYTTAPASIAIDLGAGPSYTIKGGIAPFTVSSSNAGVVKAAVSGDTLDITGLASGVADIVVFDSIGATVKINATVQGGSAAVPLYSTAPDAITVAVGATPTYMIAGGAGAYVVTSSDTTVVTVSQTGSSFTVCGVGSGTATVSIHDANGTPLTIIVTVP